jgi:Xaa-Pro aminopeptidase
MTLFLHNRLAPARYKTRRDKLLASLKKQSIDALLVFAPVNVRYLTGFTGDSSVLIIGKDICVLVTDGRFTAQLEEECPELDLDVRKVTETQPERIAKVLNKAKPMVVGYESDRVTVDACQSIISLAETLNFVAHKGEVEELRKIKDEDEIKEIRKAIHIGEKAFQLVRLGLNKEQNELDVRNELEQAMRRFGGEGPGFETIIGSGPNAALPHARPGTRVIGDDNHLLFDWGVATSQGYRGDITRVLITGKINSKLQTIYNVVKEAEQLAISRIKPGVSCQEIDALARNYIAEKGFGPKFNHGLGHSFGLEIHEGVRFSPNSTQVLQAGMVVTVEPGIYLPGFGGVRIEDDVLVTKDGHEVLSTLPRELEEMFVAW